MKQAEANEIAEKYTKELGEVLPGFIYGINSCEEFLQCYFFDFVFLTLDGKVPEEPPVAGGARGISIDKEKKTVEPVTFVGYALLKREDAEVNHLYKMLENVKARSKLLTTLKSKYNLTSDELLRLKKALENTEVKKENAMQLISELIKRVKTTTNTTQNGN